MQGINQSVRVKEPRLASAQDPNFLLELEQEFSLTPPWTKDQGD